MSDVDSAIETIETHMSEDIVINEPVEDTAIPSKDYPFKCRMCDFASARKTDLKNHKKTIHHWCFICFSSYTSQENLKDQFCNDHIKTGRSGASFRKSSFDKTSLSLLSQS